MKHQVATFSLLLMLAACGGDASDSASQTAGNAIGSKSSDLNAYLSEEKVCDVLTSDQLQALFNAPVEIKTSVSSFRDSFSCTYTWPHPDAEEREQNMVKAMMAAMSGDGPKVSMRDRMLEYQVTIGVKKSQRSAANFVPKKLTEEQINQQIEAAQKRANERLTDEQKQVAGNAANSMVESMLRKANQNEEVTGVGDAAFWSPLGTGSLEILDGDVRLTVSPVIAATKEEDIVTAKRIAAALLD